LCVSVGGEAADGGGEQKGDFAHGVRR
jgi:hypothetical protein